MDVVQPAEDGLADNLAFVLNRASNWRVLTKRDVRSAGIVIFDKIIKDCPKVFFV